MEPNIRPCQTHPDAFLQPGEDPAWAQHPRTRWALNQCRACPERTACAREALHLGNLPGDPHHYVADGVIIAGVVCTGSFATRSALTQIAGTPDTSTTTAPAHRAACTVCGREMIPARPGTTPGTGQVRAGARGRCHPCYKTALRAGALTPKHARPTCCAGPCALPLTTRARRLPGHVVHESGGWCVGCVRARGRAAAA